MCFSPCAECPSPLLPFQIESKANQAGSYLSQQGAEEAQCFSHVHCFQPRSLVSDSSLDEDWRAVTTRTGFHSKPSAFRWRGSALHSLELKRKAFIPP